MFYVSPSQLATSKEDVLSKAYVMIEAQKAIGIDAGNVGYKDVAIGIKFLERTESSGYPWVSANLRTASGKKTNIPSYRIMEIAGLKIGVFGLLDVLELGQPTQPQTAASGAEEGQPKEFTIADPIAAAQEIVAKLQSEEVDLIILLSGMTTLRNKEVAARVKGINFIISGGDPRMLSVPEREGESLIFSSANRGKYIGAADIEMIPGSTYFFMAGEKNYLEKQLKIIKAQREIFEGEISKDPEVIRKLDELKAEENAVMGNLAQLDKPSSKLTNELVPIEFDIQDRPDIAKILQKLRKQPESSGGK